MTANKTDLTTYYGDFHIHIGATSDGVPVKISGSRNLTFEAIAREASERKGLQLIGIIDCHAPGVLADIERLLDSGEMQEHADGGIRYGQTTIILGTEIEFKEHGRGAAHVLCYLPSFDAMKHFSTWMSQYVRNMNLSTQRNYARITDIQEETAAHGGVFIPAHVFTPHKSLYGSCADRMCDVLDMSLIDGIEVGLSADSKMASYIKELDGYHFLTNSDAHSLNKIAREYNALNLALPTFKEWVMALRANEGRGIKANYGLDPRLGKYHQTTCVEGHYQPNKRQKCEICGTSRFIAGVSDRIAELADRSETEAEQFAAMRAPYYHQIPLEYIPGVGPKTLTKLLSQFGTEMNVLHQATEEELAAVVGADTAKRIHVARGGDIEIANGGGGKYGRVTL
ncbi:endonuclease Q family protein [Paenibacillus taiwanensis]|uniref:endonuclease Q family protein n=1 Tax=Paenibacillus taiwanensis TaxID=401638 RepID=UPI000408FC0F|nr:endonuclease Q family protein [Paenibacillus taiwanensis]